MQNATNGRAHNGNGKKYGVFETLLKKRRDELAVATIERERRELVEVEAALKKIASGEYGMCEICESPIKEARLQALPWARLCIQCADHVSPGRASVVAGD